jgi:hypothetical protein
MFEKINCLATAHTTNEMNCGGNDLNKGGIGKITHATQLIKNVHLYLRLVLKSTKTCEISYYGLPVVVGKERENWY